MSMEYTIHIKYYHYHPTKARNLCACMSVFQFVDNKTLLHLNLAGALLRTSCLDEPFLANKYNQQIDYMVSFLVAGYTRILPWFCFHFQDYYPGGY